MINCCLRHESKKYYVIHEGNDCPVCAAFDEVEEERNSTARTIEELEARAASFEEELEEREKMVNELENEISKLHEQLRKAGFEG